MKEQLHAMMNTEFKDIKYALFTRTIKYKRSDGMMLKTNGIDIQVAKTENTSSTSNYRALQQKLAALYGAKKNIPFGREGDMGDMVMTAVFQQQNKYLQ
jgi:hypothetical protein